MAIIPMVNCKVIVGGLDLSGDSNSLSLVHAAEMLDGTVFQPSSVNRTRAYTPGLKTVDLTAGLFWDIDVDQELFSRIGFNAGEIATIAAVGEAEGDRVFFTRGVRGAYNPLSGEVGAIISAQLDLKNRGYDLVRGQLMTAGADKTVTGNSTGIQFTLPVGNFRIFSALHVLGPAVAGGGGETITCIIQSDDNAGFSSATTRLTHAAMTARGADWQEASLTNAVTDTYWRARWTIAGTAPSFPLFWSFGILP
jgi:hypothetical protein